MVTHKAKKHNDSKCQIEKYLEKIFVKTKRLISVVVLRKQSMTQSEQSSHFLASIEFTQIRTPQNAQVNKMSHG